MLYYYIKITTSFFYNILSKNLIQTKKIADFCFPKMKWNK